jgi:cardiolipin synthase
MLVFSSCHANVRGDMSAREIHGVGRAANKSTHDASQPLADQAFDRAAGAALIAGNRVRILRDASEHFPAWLDAIHSAQRSVFFDSYIIGADHVGRNFVMALAEKARAGVQVRLIYDWFGTSTSALLFDPLIKAGGEVRVFNPPRFDSLFSWVTRDHRKMIVVDGRVGYVSGLCASAKWLGDPARGLDAWRDTGVEIRGPALAELERAFAEVWEASGGRAISNTELTPVDSLSAAGNVALRVIASVPNSGGLFHLDQLIAAGTRERLWLTDAYFVGFTPYVQALCAAARDGVDVRLLVPGASDIPIVSGLSRAGYRLLLESGVRIFEWAGSMLHAKTAVADDRWARVGSTNLNLASWLSNYELDVAVEDENFAREMAAMYVEDLKRSTEIVLGRRARVHASAIDVSTGRRRRSLSGSAGRAAAGALSVGAAVGAALTNRRVLGPAEAHLLVIVAVILLAVAIAAVLWPRLIALPIAAIAAWLGGVMVIKARRLRRRRRAVQRNVRPNA